MFGGFSGANLDPVNTGYNWFGGITGFATPEATRYKLVSADGLFKNLRVVLSGAPGGTDKYTFTFMLNGNPTALTFDIVGAATSGSNMVNEIDVAPGDTISIQCDPTDTPLAVKATWTSVFEGDISAESLILGGSSNPFYEGILEYAQVMGQYSQLGGGENEFREVIPTAGTIKDLYVKLSESPGVGAGDAYSLTLRLNGATVAQSLIATIVQPATTGSDLVHNLVVAAGDIVTMMITPISTPSANPFGIWGMTFVADVDGESIVMGGGRTLDASATEYHTLVSAEAEAWGADETLKYQLGQTCTLKKLYILLSADPNGTFTFTLRIAIANSNVVATVVSPAATGNSGALEDTVANDEYVDLQVVPSDTPSGRVAFYGFVSTPVSAIAGGGAGAVVMGTKSLILDLLLEGII